MVFHSQLFVLLLFIFLSRSLWAKPTQSEFLDKDENTLIIPVLKTQVPFDIKFLAVSPFGQKEIDLTSQSEKIAFSQSFDLAWGIEAECIMPQLGHFVSNKIDQTFEHFIDNFQNFLAGMQLACPKDNRTLKRNLVIKRSYLLNYLFLINAELIKSQENQFSQALHNIGLLVKVNEKILLRHDKRVQISLKFHKKQLVGIVPRGHLAFLAVMKLAALAESNRMMNSFRQHYLKEQIPWEQAGQQTLNYAEKQNLFRVGSHLQLHHDQSLSDIYKEDMGGKKVWIEERRKIHNQMMDKKKKDIIVFSKTIKKLKRLNQKTNERPIVLLMRGNTASGKSYFLSHPPKKTLIWDFKNADIEKGIINPDDFKSYIQNEVEFGHVTNQAVHMEGADLAKNLISWSFKNLYSFIVDKRYTTVEGLKQIIHQAKKNNYFIILVDIDVELETSLSRVSFERFPGGITPPFNVIVNGQHDIRSERLMLYNDPIFKSINYYILVDNNPGKNSGVISAINKNGKLKVLNEKLFKKHTSFIPAKTLRNLFISYSDLINFQDNISPQVYKNVLLKLDLDIPEQLSSLQVMPISGYEED